MTAYGAVGDGVTVDTAAIQAAVAAANGNPEGGMIYFPPGRFVLDKPIVINRGNVLMRGAGVSGMGGRAGCAGYNKVHGTAEGHTCMHACCRKTRRPFTSPIRSAMCTRELGRRMPTVN